MNMEEKEIIGENEQNGNEAPGMKIVIDNKQVNFQERSNEKENEGETRGQEFNERINQWNYNGEVEIILEEAKEKGMKRFLISYKALEGKISRGRPFQLKRELIECLNGDSDVEYGRQPSHYIEGQNENILKQLRDGTNLNGIRKIKPRYYNQTTGTKPQENGTRLVVSKMQVRELISDGHLDLLEDLVLQGHGDRLLGETSKDPRIQTFLNIVPIYMERIYDIHRAVMRDQLEHVVILLENRRLAIARDQLGATPLHKAVWFGHYKIAHFISHHFPETLNTLDLEGRTPLHYAAALRDNKHMYGILTEVGGNKGVFDNKGKCPDYYLQYPEHLNLDEVIKRCHKVNANYLANTASRIKSKSPTRQTPPLSNGNSSSPRSDDNNGSSKESGLSGDTATEPEQMLAMLQKDNLAKRVDMSSANIRRWFEEKDVEKLERAVMEGYGEKVVRIQGDGEAEECADEEADLSGKMNKMVERINAIHTAVSNDDLTELQCQLNEKDYVLAKDHMGMTPLHRAVLLGRTTILKFLVDKFPETINVKNKDGRTALHYAASMSRKDGQNLYKILLQSGADPKIRDNHGRNADYYKTHLLTLPNKGTLKKGPGQSISTRHSEPLNRYSKQGVLERMTAALQRGDVELLHELTLEGHGRHLLGKTSWNDDVRQFLKDMPTYLASIQSLHLAVKEGNVEGFKELVNANEKLLKARDETGACPIHIAAQIGQMDIVDCFTNNYSTALNYKDGFGRTALHIAAQNGDQGLYKVLKDAGADCKILDQKGRTAEYYFHNVNGTAEFSRTLTDGKQTDNKHIRKKNHERRVSNAGNLRTRTRSVQYAKKESENGAQGDDLMKLPLVEYAEQEVNADDSNTEPKSQEEQSSESEPSAENAPSETEEKDEDDNKEEEDAEPATAEAEEDETEDKLGEDAPECETGDEAKEEADEEAEEEAKEEEETAEDVEENAEEEEAKAEEEEGKEEEEEEEKEKEEEEEKEEEKAEEDEEAKADVEEENAEDGENAEAVAEGEEEEEAKDEEENANEDEEGEKAEGEEEDAEEEEKAEEAEAAEEVEAEAAEDENKDEEGQEEEKIDEGGEENEEVKEDGEADNEEKEEEPAVEEEEADKPEEEEKPEDENADEEQKEEEPGDAEAEENNDEAEAKVEDEESPGDAENADEEKPEEEADKADEENTEETKEEEEAKDNEAEENQGDENEGETEVAPEEAGEESEGENKDEGENDDKDKEEETPESGDAAAAENEEPVAPEEGENEENNEDGKDAEAENPEETENAEGEENNADEVEAKEEGDEAEAKEEGDEEKEVDAEEAEKAPNENDATEADENAENKEADEADGEKEQTHQTKDHLDELIEHWIKEGDLLRLEHVVLAGQGDRLIERTSDDKQVQDFLDLVPIYMAKIRAVHEAVVKGQLRDVRSILTRKRFALSRDHVGASPLHLAVLHGHADVATYIISHFPETMDGPDNEGRTPLHYASALQDNGALFRILRTAGADENIEDKAGHSPKYYFNHSGELTLSELLEPYLTTE